MESLACGGHRLRRASPAAGFASRRGFGSSDFSSLYLMDCLVFVFCFQIRKFALFQQRVLLRTRRIKRSVNL